MKIYGCVSDIKYRNEENNYSVFTLEQEDGMLISMVGKLPPFAVGQIMEVDGDYIINAKFGRQFSIERVKFIEPTSVESIYKYLCSGLIKGIGPITAKAIVDKFQENTLNIIEMNPEKLSEIRGISRKKALNIAKSYNEIRDMQNTIIYLQQFEITTLTAVKIYQFYGNKTKSVMEENPYKLVEDIDGIGFQTADKIAKKMGILPDSEFRFRAGLLHLLNESTEKSGNTYLPYDTVIKSLLKLLDINTVEDVNGEQSCDNSTNETISNVIFKLCIDDKIKIIEFGGVKGLI